VFQKGRKPHELIFFIHKAYSTDSQSHVQEELLDCVLLLSKRRILGRIRPHWAERPAHIKQLRPTLLEELRGLVKRIRQENHQESQLIELFEKFSKVTNSLQLLTDRVEDNELLARLKVIVKSCTEIAHLGGTRSVEEYLRSLGISPKIYETTVIRQIDKLARYFFACTDMMRIAGKPKYRALFTSIDIETLGSFPSLKRPHSLSRCFVHAEVQQILAYERQPHHPMPRAIGCSKSACYLCDLFIREHGGYKLSYAHRRLYDKWTLPDVNWMTNTQASMFRQIIQDMIKEMQSEIRALGQTSSAAKGKAWKPYPLESRACLPLSSRTSLSECVQAEMSTDRGQAMGRRTSNLGARLAPHRFLSHSLPCLLPSAMNLTSMDLPWNRYVRTSQGPLQIRIDRLSLHVEFDSNVVGILSITLLEASLPENVPIIDGFGIPVGRDTTVRRLQMSDRVNFCLRYDSARIAQVEFTWFRQSNM
jgi:hypothetical protein